MSRFTRPSAPARTPRLTDEEKTLVYETSSAVQHYREHEAAARKRGDTRTARACARDAEYQMAEVGRYVQQAGLN